MITKAKERHKEQIVSLWSDAFGDMRENVEKYLETLLQYFLVYEEDGIVKGMLSVLPVTLNDKNGGYIYAVVTHPEHRGNGICKSLMESIKADKSYDFLVLVPQNKGLFEFYAKMEFSTVSFLKKEEISVPREVEEGYALEPISVSEYERERHRFYKNKRFIKWNENILSFAKAMYGGAFCKILKEGKNVGIVFLYKEKETVFVKEFLWEKCMECAGQIGRLFGAEKVNFVYESEKAEPTFMVYPKTFNDAKFGIFLD